jgi:ElaB/YqjD/DUF883 family membrane-anchored ribosome-binding protein
MWGSASSGGWARSSSTVPRNFSGPLRQRAITKRAQPVQEAEMTANTESYATDFTALRRDVAQLIKALSGLNPQETFGARAADAMADARDKVVEVAGDARKTTEGAGKDASAYVERNPFTAILIAAGLGLLVGMVSRLRR